MSVLPGATPPKTLMIVEDEVLVALLLKDVLEDAGYRVLELTQRTADALSVARAGHPDLALVNIQLAGNDDGAALADDLHTLGIPVVFISGQVNRARSAGTAAIASMPKPYDAADMVIAVAYLLARMAGDGSLPKPPRLEVFDDIVNPSVPGLPASGPASDTIGPKEETPGGIQTLFQSPDLAGALESDRFKQFLDLIPIAVAVSELKPVETVIYANVAFERLSGRLNTTILGGGWDALPGQAEVDRGPRLLAEAITSGKDYLGSFSMPHDDTRLMVDAWSSVIEDDGGQPAYRLVALVAAAARDASVLDELEDRIREKDVQLLELQHRVKNNLQMITALIRIEARGVSDLSTGEGFDRLAGRVEALGLLYRALGDTDGKGVVDLGIYLSEIASAVMRAHAVQGIHLDLQVDTWPVSVDVAMPTGLVVNELLTNALKHAFRGSDGGTITLHCRTDPVSGGCRLLIGDDGVGMPPGYAWPRPGKLSALIVRSLLQNARAQMRVDSAPGRGTRVEIDLGYGDVV